jgi:putative intracellular protease/amidase
MQPKKFVALILLSSFAFILLMPFYEKSSIKNEANASEPKAQVLLLIRHGFSSDTDFMLKEEVGVMTSMLVEAGFKVIVASYTTLTIFGKTLNLQPNLKLADVKVNDYVGIIMPCMARGSYTHGWHPYTEEISLIKEAVAQGKPIAAQRSSVIILAEAGALVGKKCTFKSEFQSHPNFVGAIYSGIGVVQDGNIITSSHCPRATENQDESDWTSQDEDDGTS